MTVPESCKGNNVGYKYQRQIRMELLGSSNLLAKCNYETSIVSILSDIITGIPVCITKGSIKIVVYNNGDMDTIVQLIKVLLC